MKKRLALILLLVWLFVIFYLSSQNGAVSGSNSGGIIKYFLSLFHFSNADDIFNAIHNPLRECMHAVEYFILGLLSYNYFRLYKFKSAAPFCIVFCILYAISDEIHQIFVPGRTFEYFDLYLDIFGSIIGIFLMQLAFKDIKKRTYLRFR